MHIYYHITDDHFAVIEEHFPSRMYRIKELRLKNIEKDGIRALLAAKKAYHKIQMHMEERGNGYQLPDVDEIRSKHRVYRLIYAETNLYRGMNLMHYFYQGKPLKQIHQPVRT